MKNLTKKTKIAIVGAGAFGFYIAKYLGDHDFENVFMYDVDEDAIISLKEKRKHPIHFPEILLPESITPTLSLEECISDSELIFAAVPAQMMRKATLNFREYINKDIYLINVAKALELDTNKRMDEVFDDCLKDYLFMKGKNKYHTVVIAGGMLASEGVLGDPLEADIACSNLTVARKLRRLLRSHTLRLEPTSDIVGTEIAGALKNTGAIAVGICAGMGYGISTQSTLTSAFNREGRRFAIDYGNYRETPVHETTFKQGGNAWETDLLTTCRGGRNKIFGQEIGEGSTPEQALAKMRKQGKGTIEGHASTKVIYSLSRQFNKEYHSGKENFHIIKNTYEILYQGKDLKEALLELMNLPPTNRNIA